MQREGRSFTHFVNRSIRHSPSVLSPSSVVLSFSRCNTLVVSSNFHLSLHRYYFTVTAEDDVVFPQLLGPTASDCRTTDGRTNGRMEISLFAPADAADAADTAFVVVVALVLVSNAAFLPRSVPLCVTRPRLLLRREEFELDWSSLFLPSPSSLPPALAIPEERAGRGYSPPRSLTRSPPIDGRTDGRTARRSPAGAHR